MMNFLIVSIIISICFSLYSKEEKSFVIVIPSYNNKDWYQKNLDSVFMQKYNNYRVIYIDDFSTDNTGQLVEEYIKKHKQESKVKLIKNTERKLALANHYDAVHSCKPNDIIVNLDGDDFLAHENVLEYLNNVYQDANIWLTYGQFKWYPYDLDWVCTQVPDEVIINNLFRNPNYYYTISHLRSFYAALFKNIKKDDLLYENKFYSMAADSAIMYPMLEMAGTHIKFIPDVLYIYNNANQLNDHKINEGLQKKINNYIKSLPKYQPLKFLFNKEQDQN